MSRETTKMLKYALTLPNVAPASSTHTQTLTFCHKSQATKKISSKSMLEVMRQQQKTNKQTNKYEIFFGVKSTKTLPSILFRLGGFVRFRDCPLVLLIADFCAETCFP